MESYFHRPEEVLNMFSEALKILDRNTVQYMVEEQMDQILEQQDQIDQQHAQLIQKDSVIAQQQAEIARLQKLLDDKGRP